jgi:hypothetical protein
MALVSAAAAPTRRRPDMNTATNTTHLLWANRWVEVRAAEVCGEQAWEFKNGRDAVTWLMFEPPAPPSSETRKPKGGQ